MKHSSLAVLTILAALAAPGCNRPRGGAYASRPITPTSIDEFVDRHGLYEAPYRRDPFTVVGDESIMILQVGSRTPPAENPRHRLWLRCYSGRVHVTMAHARYLLMRGDEIEVPQGVVYYVTNVRPQNEAILVATYSPQFLPKDEVRATISEDHEAQVVFHGRPGGGLK